MQQKYDEYGRRVSGNVQVPFTCDSCKSDDVKQTWLNGTIALLKCNHCGNKGRNVRR